MRFSLYCLPERFNSFPPSLVAFHSSSESDHSAPLSWIIRKCAHPFGFTIADKSLTTAAFHAVFSPSAYSQNRPATLPAGIHPAGFGSPSVFLALMRPYSDRFLPVMFNSGPTHGVSSSRVDFHSQSILFSRTFNPSCGWLLTWLLSRLFFSFEHPG